jgi:YHS domain-containing protein
LVSCVLWLLRRTLLRAAAPKTRRAPAGRPSARPTSTTPVAKPIQLQRDPVCGMHVAPEISFTLERAGHAQFFCSAECRDRYVQSERRAASA